MKWGSREDGEEWLMTGMIMNGDSDNTTDELQEMAVTCSNNKLLLKWLDQFRHRIRMTYFHKLVVPYDLVISKKYFLFAIM